MIRGLVERIFINPQIILRFVLVISRIESTFGSCKPGSVNETFSLVVDSSTLKKISIESGFVSTVDSVEDSYYGAAITPDGLYCLASVKLKNQTFTIKNISIIDNSYVYPHYKLLVNPSVSAFFTSPVGISIAPDGAFALVADTSGKIQKIDLDRHLVVPSIAGIVSGSSWLNPFQDGQGPTASFTNPTDVRISPDGQYALVADYGNHRIRKIEGLSASITMVSTIAGSLQGYLDGSNSLFNYPNSIAISQDGQYALVADSNNHAIRKILREVEAGAASERSGGRRGV